MTRATIQAPPTATQLIRTAQASGWHYASSWGVDSDGLPLHRVSVARPDTNGHGFTHAVIVWHTDVIKKSLTVTNAVLRTERDGRWEDLRSVRVLANLIRSGALIRA